MARQTGEASPTIWLASSPNFSGGQDTATDPRDIEKEKFTWLENGYLSRSNRAVKRPGFANVTASALSDAARRMVRFKTSDGTVDTLLVWAGHDLYTVSDAGVVAHLIYNYFDATGRIAAAQYGDAVYMSDGVDGVQVVKQAASAQAAHIVIDQGWTSDYTIEGTVDIAGAAGNDYTIRFVDPGLASQSLSVAMVGKAITVNLATDADGLVTSTAAAIVTALNADGAIGAVVTWTGTDAVVVDPFAAWHFYNGADIGDIYIAETAIAYSFTHLCTRVSSDHLFGVDAADPATLRWSGALTPETWAADDQWRPANAWTGVLEVGAVLLGFQEDAIYRIDGTDSTTWTATRADTSGLGLPAGASDTLMELEGVAVFLSHSGLAVYEGTRPRTISDVVKNAEDSSRNLMPSDADTWDGAFTLVLGDLLTLFFKAASDSDGCDMAVVYDFRRGLWSGPWMFDSPVTCGSCDPSNSGNAALPYLGTFSGHVERQYLNLDNGAAFSMLFRSKTFDCGREAIDKQVIDMRATYKAAAETTITMRLYREGAVVSETTFTVEAGEGVLNKRIPHIRGRDFYIELESSDDVYVEFSGCEFDYFFVRLR